MNVSRTRRVVLGVCAAVVVALAGAAPAAAHPLGNFSINHLDSLRFEAGSIIDDAIVDTAEIPTAQAKDIIDSDHDGTASAAELDAYGRSQCEAYRKTLSLTVASTPAIFTTASTAFSYRPGQAGLQTTRLECRFYAPADLAARRAVKFENTFAPNRVGWHEIIAVGGGSSILDSPVPTTSVTDGLTKYPVDLLSSPLNVRSASFTIVPGSGVPTATKPSAASKPTVSGFSKALGPFSRVVDRINKTFNDLVGRHQLTLGVGLLAIGLALILGASHALLPGHGKTVMAAYIAGRQGSVKDAVLVGATVTATHTGGVLLLGLALTLSTSLAGESVLGWLGVVSGLMIAILGGSLLLGAVRRRRSGEFGLFGHGHQHGGAHGHVHGPAGHQHHGHQHHRHDHDVRRELVQIGAAPLSFDRTPLSFAMRANVGGAAPVSAVAQLDLELDLANEFSRIDGEHEDDHSHDEAPVKHFSRRGLIGMGIAGGLVPSPSALVVLLSAIALGRTVFGVVLVIGYGAGMAGTLTLAGVLLVRVRDRYQNRVGEEPGRLRSMLGRWTRLAPYLTAALVLVVGLGLAVRSLGQI